MGTHCSGLIGTHAHRLGFHRLLGLDDRRFQLRHLGSLFDFRNSSSMAATAVEANRSSSPFGICSTRASESSRKSTTTRETMSGCCLELGDAHSLHRLVLHHDAGRRRSIGNSEQIYDEPLGRVEIEARKVEATVPDDPNDRLATFARHLDVLEPGGGDTDRLADGPLDGIEGSLGGCHIDRWRLRGQALLLHQDRLHGRADCSATVVPLPSLTKGGEIHQK